MKSTNKLQSLLNNLDIHERDIETYQRMMLRSPSDNLKKRLNSTMVAKHQLEQAIVNIVPMVEKELELIKLEKEFSVFNIQFNAGFCDIVEKIDRELEIKELKKEIDERIN